MEETNRRVESYLCEAVRIYVNVGETDLGACHCTKCQKWAGGPLMEVECGSDVIFEGSENIAFYASSKWAVRGFCKICGSHLFIKDKRSGDYIYKYFPETKP